MEIKTFNLGYKEIQDSCRIMVCQLNSRDFDWKEEAGLQILVNNEKILLKINSLLSVAKQHNIDLLIFPELGIPIKLMERLQEWSKNNEIIIIAGSHYYENNGLTVNRSPIIIDGDIYFSEKLCLSPLEKSPIKGYGAVEGSRNLIFKNTRIGNIGHLICADYLDDSIRQKVINEVDILNISCFQRDSSIYYRRINIDCENSEEGIYITYSNFVDEKYGDGRSAIFGLMDKLYQNKLYEFGCTDMEPDKKIIELNLDDEYFICDVNLSNKRPAANRNIQTAPNVILIEKNKIQEHQYDFIKKIAHDDERYKRINDLFVPPEEYEDICNSLEENNIVFIIGDPGIGKTYLAVKILKDYYEKGYEPIWVSGLDKEERELQSKFLIDFEPNDKQVIYFEDPFGKVSFEKRDGLYQVFNPLISKLKYINCKVIVTSRREIFEKFTKESLLNEDLYKLSKELNINKPSYSKDGLVNIYRKLSKLYLTDEYETLIIQSINDGKINNPLMIRDLVFTLRYNIDINSEINIDLYILSSRRDIIRNFSYEIMQSDISVIVLLYLVLLSGTKGKPFVNSTYNSVLDEIGKLSTLEVDRKSFNIVLRSQIGYRIEQFGFSKTAYKLSHPMYEECLNLLYLNDSKCETIVNAIIRELIVVDPSYLLKSISRFTTKQPEFALKLIYNYLDFYSIGDIEAKIGLVRKLISLYNSTKEYKYFSLGLEIYSLDTLISDINTKFTNWTILAAQLSLCVSYVNNSPFDFDIQKIDEIKWEIVFGNKNDFYFNHNRILHLLNVCYTLNPSSIQHFVNSKGRNIIKKTYLFCDESDRKRMLKLFKGNSLQRDLFRYKKFLDANEQKGNNKFKLFRKILFNEYKYFGKLIVDDGALNAIYKPWLNLLPVGILEVQGNFESGQIIGICDKNGDLVLVGMVEYSSTELNKIKGRKSWEFYEILEKIHTNCAIKSDFMKKIYFERSKWQYVFKN